MKWRAIFCFFLCISVNQADILAQNTGVIKGYVIDSETGNPLLAATVALVSSTKETIGGTATLADGTFELKNIPLGHYRLKISFLGYKSYKDSVHITQKKLNHSLGRIELKASSEKLNEIQVTGEKNADRVADIDKKVYYADNNLLGSGASILQMLKTIPAINVDVNGRISLRGSRGVVVYIDGRPSGLSGASRQAVLEGIPITAIERIEIITNPSAKYDADGASGIINIIMKKTGGLGTNITISGSAGTREKGMLGGFISHDSKKWNFIFNANYKYSNLWDNGDSYKSISGNSSPFTIRQTRDGLEKGGTYLASTALMYRINTSSSIQAKGSVRYTYNTDLSGMTQEQRDTNGVLQVLLARNTTKAQREMNYDLDLNFEKRFKRKNTKLTAEVSYSRSDDNDHIDYVTPRYYQSPVWQQQVIPTLRQVNAYPKNGFFMGRSDFEIQIKKKMNFECGLKANIRHNDNDYRSLDYNYANSTWADLQGISNRFVYHEQVYAGYAIFGHEIKKFSYKLGARIEQALISTDQVTLGQKNYRGYFQVYPSVHLGYELSDVSEFRLSYTRRVNRPGASNLNPFPDFSNPLSIRYGNPMLNPEYTNNAEFTYSYKKGNHNFSAAAYAKYVTGVIGRYNTIDTSGVSYITYKNLNSAIAGGVEFTAKNEFYRWWSMISSANVYYYKVNANNVQNDLNNSTIGALVKMMHTFKFLKTFQLQWSAVFVSPQSTAQSITKPRFYTDIAVRKDFFKNKLSLIFVLSDVLNTNQTFTDTRGLGFTNSSRRKVESRIAMLTITWRWGSNSKNKKQILEDDVNDLDPDD
jgi:outer membrane receptor protein involved in Fe transport